MRVSRTGIDLLERRNLRLGETGGRFGSIAKQGGWFEIALGWIVNHAVFHAVARVARSHYRGFDGSIFIRWNISGRIHLGGLQIPSEGSNDVGERSRRSARDEPVEIGWIALRLHQGLTSTVGTTAEVRMLDLLAIERVHDGLGFLGGLMNGAVAEVDDLFGVAERPAGIGCVTLVTGVGGGRGVAVLDRVRQRGVIDGAGESAVALAM